MWLNAGLCAYRSVNPLVSVMGPVPMTVAVPPNPAA